MNMNMKKPPQFLLLCLLTIAGSESGEAKTGITPLEKLYGRIGLTWNAQGKTDRVNGKVEEHWEYSGRVNAGVTLNGGFDGLWSNEAYATGTGSVSYDETCTYTTVDNSANPPQTHRSVTHLFGSMSQAMAKPAEGKPTNTFCHAHIDNRDELVEFLCSLECDIHTRFIQDGKEIVVPGASNARKIFLIGYNPDNVTGMGRHMFTTSPYKKKGDVLTFRGAGNQPSKGIWDWVAKPAMLVKALAQNPKNFEPSSNGLTGPWQGALSIGWNVRTQPKEVEVVVEPKNYESWRPMASVTSSEPGNQLTVMAKLQDRNGGKPKQKATRFRFELLEVSREPGIAINFPTQDAETSFDLKLWPADQTGGPNPLVSNELQTLNYVGKDLTEATAVISSHDWGAWGKLKVTAEMEDGEEVVGYLQGHKDQEEVLLPKRKPDSKIADIWKEDNGASDKPDDADDEKDPEGDQRAGDGLTLYEEYRGFYEGGVHQYADPLKKDYFIRDTLGGRSKDGIAMFAAASGLVVHHEFTDDEFRPSRVINLNFSNETPHTVLQHGVVLRDNDAPGESRAHGGPGLPRMIDYVGILTTLDKTADGWNETPGKDGGVVRRDHYASTIAHELLHAASVWHHGEADHNNVRWRAVRKPSGVNGAQESIDGGPWYNITLRTEDEAPIDMSSGHTPTKQPWIGRENGQHSGMEDCIMRYGCSNGYVSKADPAIRYFVPLEMTGMFLCEDPAGNGVNASDHAPQSRYGDANAAARRGNCKHQVCVNDALDADERRQ